jgi:hypothetical protein
MSDKTFNFKMFQNVGSKFGSYTISISRRGAFGINAGFYNAENISDFSHAVLYYDKDERAIGISFTKSADATGAFKVTHGKGSGYIVAQSFFLSNFPRNRGDFTKFAGRYTPEIYNDPSVGKVFYIVLKDNVKSEEITND